MLDDMSSLYNDDVCTVCFMGKRLFSMIVRFPLCIVYPRSSIDVVSSITTRCFSPISCRYIVGSHAILLVLTSGVYHCRMIVDGVPRHVCEQPHVIDERGQVADHLDIHASKDYICSV